ncbi:hypothetical protein EW146_g8762 [Bondarzewia mesenterica]|uniref:ATP-dependent DNA helicase n=1 Tax=Bondarzewia mesenterica TaxID=1095465 RepID=A0A4S4LBT0_9AGAM|nr:hypothetical protein EW146_g8762 [Bondarzewia mesenterica]
MQQEANMSDVQLQSLLVEEALTVVEPIELKLDQQHAYEIVRWHLEQTLAGKSIPALRLLIHGKGGMGKSKVIQLITAMFEQHSAENMLLKAAYIGITASLINEKTMHSISMISHMGHPLSDETKVWLSQF